jgi:phosphohistidine phosphatase SixA
LLNKPTIEPVARLYNTSETEMLSFIKEQNNRLNAVAIVSHNPAITTILNLLRPKCSLAFAKSAFNMEFTAKMVVIESEASDWQDIDAANCNICDVFYPTSNN